LINKTLLTAGRFFKVLLPVLVVLAAACSRRPPALAPPPAALEAVEGYGSSSVRGAEAVVKGKFSFVFRRPGLGRIAAIDPLGRTMYTVIVRDDRAVLVIPSEKAYVEDTPEAMMKRFLGFALLPDDVIRLLGGRWSAEDAAGAWSLERDAAGRVVHGSRGGTGFTVAQFFSGAGVPREVVFSRPGTLARVKVLSLRFNPPPRPGLFEAPDLSRYTRKTWDDLQGEGAR
jgi:outer membrane lipoprotein-sorting protein